MKYIPIQRVRHEVIQLFQYFLKKVQHNVELIIMILLFECILHVAPLFAQLFEEK